MAEFREPQVVLFSTNVTRSAAFYASQGFEEVFRTPATGEPIHVDLVLDGYRIGIASVDSTRDDHGLDPVAAGQRAAVVLWTADVRSVYAELVAAGDPPPDPIRALANFTRSTASSTGMNAQRSACGPLSSPAAAQRCAEGAGLDSGAAATAQSAMPSIAAHRCTGRRQCFHRRRCIHGASTPVSNLHQLDGRDLAETPRPAFNPLRLDLATARIGVAGPRTQRLV